MVQLHRRRARFEKLEARQVLAPVAINSGAVGVEEFLPDQLFTGGRGFRANGAVIDLSGVADQDPAPAFVYETERGGVNGGDFQYAIPNLIPGQAYDLRLHFAEIFWTESGKRSFDVDINGVKVLDDYDIFVEAGGHDVATIEEFTATADAAGVITLDFLSEVNNAKVSGIEVAEATTPAPGSAWSEVAPSPIAVFEGQGAAVGDEHYVIGGFVDFLAVTTEFHSYNPATDTWTQRADFPEITEEIVLEDGTSTGDFVTGGITHGASAVDGESIYVVGGYVGESPGQSTAVVSVYDTETDTWARTTSLPEPRGGGGVAIVGRQLHYFSGGTRTFGDNAITDHPDHWVLDLGATDSPLDDAAQWTPLADLPNPRNHSAGAVIDGIIYAVGGQLEEFEAFQNQQVLEAYDPATDTWTRLADIPIPLGHLMASVVVADGKLITIGGVTNSDNPAGQDGTRRTATVFSYDPATDQWSTLESLPDERQSPAVGLVNGQIVVASGASADGREFTTYVADAADLLANPGSNLVLSQSTLDFGAVTVGDSAQQQFILTNTGLAGGDSITIDPATASLTPDDGAYSVSFASAGPIVLAPGEATTVTVTYSPLAAASAAAALSIPHDGINRPIEVALSGTGAPAGGAGEVVYRVNAGGEEIAGSPSWAVDTDTDPSPFSNFDPNSSTSKAKTWAAPVDGSNLPDVPTEIFQTERFDKPNQPNLEWDFPVAAGDYEVRLYFAENWSGAFAEGVREFDVQIEGVTVLDDFDVFANFGAETGGVVSLQVTSDSNLDIDFLRNPGKNNPNVKGIEILTVGTGTGTQADLGVSASTLDFGTVAVGASSQQQLTLTHLGVAGNLPITIDPATASIAPAGEFTFDFGVTAPIVLQAGQSTVVTVTYAPDAAVSHTATLTIPHDGLNSPETIALVGVGEDAGPQPVSFGKSVLGGVTGDLDRPTSLQFGPDDRLYVSQQDGLIRVYDVVRDGPNSYTATNEEVITLIADIPNRDDDGTLNPSVTGRLVTGLLVTGTAENPVLYVTSGDPRVGGGPTGTDLNLDTNSGILTRLTWNGSSWDQVDLVRGLPRSDENHTANGMDLDEATNTLYIAIGGNTNAGATSNNFAFLPEYALSAAILSVDLDAIGDTTYDLPTLDDEDQPGADATDPFGGNNGKNQAIVVPGGPVQVYSPGFRNPYDVVFTSDGRLYSVDNGPNAGWGDVPVGEGPEGNATNEVNEPGLSYDDQLHHITGPGFYGGHPNPTRSNPANTFNDTNPQSPVPGPNPIESDFLIPGVEDGALALFPNSTNGIAEYTSDEFGGALQGDLIIASFDNTIKRVKLNAAGDQVVLEEDLFSNVGFRPLDVTAPGSGAFAGSIWVADIALGTVIVFEPTAGGGGTPDDDDGDGYSNEDEIANGTDPNSAADFPADNDGDFLSDLLDPDDDNDAIGDTNDAFAIDADNGSTTAIGVAYEWENEGENLGGLLGLGFTGLMSNGLDNYASLFDPTAVTAGGAAGVFTLDTATAGTALGSSNDQEQAFQIGFDASSATTPFAAETAVVAPFNGVTPEAGQQMGLYLGLGDQDNYVQIVVAGDNGGQIEVTAEFQGNPTLLGTAPLPVAGLAVADLRLTVDPVALTIQASYSTDGVNFLDIGPALSVPPIALSGSLAAGLISTNPSANPLPVTWDFLRVVPTTAQQQPAVQSLQLLTQIPGDIDGDGAVVAADRQVWIESYGSTEDLQADVNGDGVVNAADMLAWREREGQWTASIIVPEPEEGTGGLSLLTLPALSSGGSASAQDEALVVEEAAAPAGDDDLLLLAVGSAAQPAVDPEVAAVDEAFDDTADDESIDEGVLEWVAV